ncbi:MAG TPA: hypothetical protein G4O06_03470 [Dehalococcoidia bacterium]|nr:hypothetical protein [Dehalococcoidia bacterium]
MESEPLIVAGVDIDAAEKSMASVKFLLPFSHAMIAVLSWRILLSLFSPFTFSITWGFGFLPFGQTWAMIPVC